MIEIINYYMPGPVKKSGPDGSAPQIVSSALSAAEML
jgi:hypothetical protein